jgi:RIO kinase 1
MLDDPPQSWDEDEGPESPFDHFLAEGLITEVIRPIKSGKEASVHLCRANPSTTGRSLLAVKAYLPRERRNFRNDAIYKEGRVITKRRLRVAMEKKTRFGRTIEDALWVDREVEALRALTEAGADVPTVVAASGNAILMDYIGDEETPAPQLRHVDLDADEAKEIFDRLIANVERFLRHNVIHADLSAFNVLYWDGDITVIDLPQFVDPRTNHNAYPLLSRDVQNLVDHFGRYGVRANAGALTADLWTRFIFAEL